MTILNLYACLGGNRYKWNEVKEDIEVTAIELDPELARLYQERFPDDTVIIADAHKFLLHNYKNYDFIWSSPPCPSHSRINISQYTRENWKPRYPSMMLYEEIIFLKYYYKGKYVVENVIPYYEPLITAKKRDRHLYWTNFNLPNDLKGRKNPDLSRTKDLINVMSKYHDYDFRQYKGEQPMNKIARNLVDYEAGKTIFETMLGIQKKENINQTELF